MRETVGICPTGSSREEVEIIRNRLDEKGEWTPIGVSVPDLAGEFFMVTGTGKYFRNIIVDPEACLTIIEVMIREKITGNAGGLWKAAAQPASFPPI